jgi:hypothetical protein
MQHASQLHPEAETVFMVRRLTPQKALAALWHRSLVAPQKTKVIHTQKKPELPHVCERGKLGDAVGLRVRK